MRKIATMHREDRRFPPKNPNEHSRLCTNCHQVVIETLRSGATNFLNVVQQRSSKRCIICDDDNDLKLINFNGRLKLYLDTKKFSLDGSRCCQLHLNKDGHIHYAFYGNINTLRKPVTLDFNETQKWLEGMHSAYEKAPVLQFFDESKYSDEDFQVLAGVKKINFENLFECCENFRLEKRKIHTKDLLCFLVKMHQGLSDDFLKVIYFIFYD
jgi:hypothetical protein